MKPHRLNLRQSNRVLRLEPYIVAFPSSVVQDVAAPPVPSMASRVEVLPVTSQPSDAVVPSGSADVEASVVFASPPALLTNWKFAFASVLHLTFKHLCLKMGAPVTAEDVDYLLRLVPADIQTYQPTFIILMALQAVLNTPGFLYTLKEWLRRGHKVPPSDNRTFQHTLDYFPAGTQLEWNSNAFGLCTLLIGRFLDQPLPATMDHFLLEVQDLVSLAGLDSWMIECVAEVLFFYPVPYLDLEVNFPPLISWFGLNILQRCTDLLLY